jgi:hypothetical protein
MLLQLVASPSLLRLPTGRQALGSGMGRAKFYSNKDQTKFVGLRVERHLETKWLKNILLFLKMGMQ